MRNPVTNIKIRKPTSKDFPELQLKEKLEIQANYVAVSFTYKKQNFANIIVRKDEANVQGILNTITVWKNNCVNLFHSLNLKLAP